MTTPGEPSLTAPDRSAPHTPRANRRDALHSDDRPEFWNAPIDQLFARLRSSPTGLAGEEPQRRLDRCGLNTPTSQRQSAPLRLLRAQVTSPIAVLLFAAAVLSILLGERTDGGIILAILLVSGLLGFWQEYHAAGAIERLLALIRTTATVLRDGRVQEIALEHVVPGDVAYLVAGATAPGDARLIDARDLFVDQATLTGESYPAEKSAGVLPPDTPLAARTNVVYLGTHVVSGTATVLVVRTGANTEFGTIARRLAQQPQETEFERGVRRFGALLLQITLVLVIIIFAVNVALHRPVLDALLFTLALAVGLTPQLLPAIVSVTLAQGARHMAAARVIVRRLAAIEDLGGMDVLCTDKTGTITEGTVAVHGVEDWTGASSERARLLAYLNATFETGFANPIDIALRASPPAGADVYDKVDEVPYDFARKRLSIAVRARGTGVTGGEHLLITKGALASVLDVCDRAEDAAGNVIAISAARTAIQARFEALSVEGYRCLGVAYRQLADDRPVSRTDERALIFAGILVLADPLKAGVTDTLGALTRLGIRVKLVTGDNRHVAARLAEQAGIDASGVRTGRDLQHLDEAALGAVVSRVDVFAEVEPYQKERIILALKKGGHSVGFLGDGINDASALHAADVGISVESATDVTKQAADVVLLDKDLAVLARGVAEGSPCVREHAQVRVHHHQRELRQHVQHGRRVAARRVSPAAPQADPAHQRTHRPARDGDRHRPARPRAGAAPASLGYAGHPPLHDGIRVGELGVRLSHLWHVALAGGSGRHLPHGVVHRVGAVGDPHPPRHPHQPAVLSESRGHDAPGDQRRGGRLHDPSSVHAASRSAGICRAPAAHGIPRAGDRRPVRHRFRSEQADYPAPRGAMRDAGSSALSSRR